MSTRLHKLMRVLLVGTVGAVLLFVGSQALPTSGEVVAQQPSGVRTDSTALAACHQDLVAIARRLGGGFGLTVDDYLRCVEGCKKLFSGPDLTECIKGCSQFSGARLSGVVLY